MNSECNEVNRRAVPNGRIIFRALRVRAALSGARQKRRKAMRTIHLHLEELEARNLLSIFTPAQIRHAYGFDQISFANGRVQADGSGQTIAIVEAFHDPKIAGDL